MYHRDSNLPKYERVWGQKLQNLDVNGHLITHIFLKIMYFLLKFVYEYEGYIETEPELQDAERSKGRFWYSLQHISYELRSRRKAKVKLSLCFN
jgi:hypothetical protein